MNIDAGFIYALLDSKDPKNLALVNASWFEDIWVKVYEFCCECVSNPMIHALPALETVVAKWDVTFQPSKEGVGFWYDELRQRRARMDLEVLLKEKVLPLIENPANPDGNKPLQAAEEMMTECATIRRKYRINTSGESISFNDDVDPRIREYEERKRLQGLMGIPFPFDPLNTCTGGLIGGELSVVLACSGIGKTWFLCLVARHAYNMGKSVLFISQEMQPKRLAIRMDALMAGVSPDRMRRGCLTPDEEKRLMAYYAGIKKNPGKMHLYGPQDVNNLAAFEALLSVMHTQVGLVIWDSAYLCVRSDTWEARAEFVRAVKQTAEVFNIPVLMTWQLNRDGKASLTAAIQTDADHNFELFKDEGMKDLPQMRMKSTKTRDGIELTNMLLQWDVSKGQFSVLDWEARGIGEQTNFAPQHRDEERPKIEEDNGGNTDVKEENEGDLF